MASEGASGVMVENGGHSSLINFPKYKRRRVSAVRDFPPGCGPNAPKADFSGNALIHGVHKSVHSVLIEHNSIQVGLEITEQEKKNEELSFDELPESENKKVSAAAESSHSSNGVDKSVDVVLKAIEHELMMDEHSSGEFLPQTLQVNAEYITKQLLPELQEQSSVLNKDVKLCPPNPVSPSAVCEERNYPARRRVSAVRDFPPGCGPNPSYSLPAKSIVKKVRFKLKPYYYEPIKDKIGKVLIASARSSADGVARNKVRETLRLFQALTRKILQREEYIRRVDLHALGIFKEKGLYSTAGKAIIGHVAGVEVGDEFHYRVELMIIGLHRPSQGGIDSGGELNLAISVVDSGGYDNRVDDYDVWTYTGQGGNSSTRDKSPEDQKLERGNLALKNSIKARNLVRVIRGVKDTKCSTTYTYYGVYTVERYWQEISVRGIKEYKFELKRVSGQPDLPWKEVKRVSGLCVNDISKGKEKFPIRVVNTIDKETPPPFTYISRMIYASSKPLRTRGCDECVKGCTNCLCVVKNGGIIPYNSDGAIVEAKAIVYECGPCCKCPVSCYNRVSQLGIIFQLEVFKTESRGWGVRSLSSIPSGGFVCEYTGELLEDMEAEMRVGNDEYLFDIGQNRNDHSIWDGLSGLLPDGDGDGGWCKEVAEESCFTIDAAEYGNVGRFINHSCSPNLYAQNVLYDHGDTRMPHIMLFAAENIPPLQELTYHYNYKMGQVYDADGKVKVKYCYCRSPNCSGRLY